MRIIALVCISGLAVVAVYALMDVSVVSAWAVETQRQFQNQIASAIRALKTGAPGAYLALLVAAASYGFVHALGPGHGKFLVGGVGLGTSVTNSRLIGLALISSLVQSLWAIILVNGGFFLLEASAQQLTFVAEDVLGPMSYAAIAGIGLIIAWRGIRSITKKAQTHHAHDHDHDNCGCHSHGPSPEEVNGVTSLRDACALVFSIAVRPCTSAIFLLVIAWQMDLQWAGAAAVIAMGLGTAGLTSLVAVSSVTARRLSIASTNVVGGFGLAIPALRVFSGLLLASICLGLLVPYL